MWQTTPKLSGAALWLGDLGGPSAGLSRDHSRSCGHLAAQRSWKAQDELLVPWLLFHAGYWPGCLGGPPHGLSSSRRLDWASSQPGGPRVPKEQEKKLQASSDMGSRIFSASLRPDSVGQGKSRSQPRFEPQEKLFPPLERSSSNITLQKVCGHREYESLRFITIKLTTICMLNFIDVACQSLSAFRFSFYLFCPL